MDPDLELTGFEGTCRLFPLPEVVLFPHCVLPLHVFEPRYRQMARDALAGDKLIAMVKLQDGTGWNTAENPPIESVACLGKIFDHQRLDDGRYNLLLVGLKRVRIDCELESDRLYRSAGVTLLDDLYPEHRVDEQGGELVSLFRELCLLEGRVEPEIARLLDTPIPLGVLSDLLGHYLGLPSPVKQAFLEAVDVEERINRLIGFLKCHLGAMKRGPDGDFPPSFSLN